jgi:hypothetical protein
MTREKEHPGKPKHTLIPLLEEEPNVSCQLFYDGKKEILYFIVKLLGDLTLRLHE